MTVAGAAARGVESTGTGFGAADFSGVGRVRSGLPASRTTGVANEAFDTGAGVVSRTAVCGATVFACGCGTGFGSRDTGGSDVTADADFGMCARKRRYVNPAAPRITTIETATSTRSRVDDDAPPRARGGASTTMRPHARAARVPERAGVRPAALPRWSVAAPS